MKKLLRLLTCVLTLSLLLAIPVSASSLGGSGTEGDADVGSVDKKDGFLDSKSGYIVYTSDANGNATSDIVAFCWNGGDPYSTTGAPVIKLLQTRFNQGITSFASNISAPWGYPPFNGTSGTGTAIKSWLLTQRDDNFAYNADYVMAEILNFTEAQIEAWYADENNRLNVEPFIFGGYYLGGSASSYSGLVYAANTTIWARLTDANNFGKKYTHKSLPNSLQHDIPIYAQFPVPAVKDGIHDSGTILAHAYGIVTVKPIKGIQVVKIYKTSGVVDNTSYGFGEPPINVKDEGSYKVTKWSTSKQKTKATSNKADWGEVVAGCELVQSGSGVAVVDMPPAEKAIFILLEREKEIAPVVLNQEAIRAHELNYLFRYSDGLRDEFNGKNGRFEGANFKFTDVIPLYEKFDNEPHYLVKNWRTEDKYKVIEDYI